MNKYKIRILQGFLLLFSVSGLMVFNPKSLIISLLVYIFLETFVGNATLHRFYGHRAFRMKPWKKNIMTWLAHHICVGSVLGWTGQHRWHHMYSDTEKDLHSPTKNGILHILFGIWEISLPRSLISDLLIDKKLLWWHRNYFRYHVVLLIVLLFLSPWALVFLYAIPNILCLFSGYIIAILPHLDGEVKNSRLTEIFTFGEGWHKYHHDNPQSYRFSKHDLTAVVIDLFLKDRELEVKKV